jgi:hypothetical protein
LAAAPLIADYRANRFPSDVQWSAWQVSRSIEKPPGWGRFWLHPNVLKASELVFAHLSDVDVVERVGGATVADVGQALHDLDARLRRRSQQAPRVVRVALDYEEFPNAVPRDAIGLIGVDHSDGSWDEDTFLRYELKDSTGLIVKISCAEMIQGLGVATRMVETLLSTHPDVTTWHTTTKRVRQSAF